MPLTTLSCDTLGDLHGGTFRAAIDNELRKAINDFNDRSAEDGKERTVTIKVCFSTIEKMPIITGECCAKLPPFRTGATRADVRVRGHDDYCLLFQTENPENPRQPTFRDVVDESEVANDEPGESQEIS